MKRKNTAAYIMLVLRSVIYGSSILFTGSLLKSADTLDILALRFLIAALAFILLVLCGAVKVNFKGKSIKILLATAIFEPVGYFIFETLGIARTTTSLAGILAAFTTVFVVLLETVFLGEKTTLLQKLLLLSGITGVCLITFFSKGDSSGKNTPLGIAFLLAAYLSGALFVICSRKSSANSMPLRSRFSRQSPVRWRSMP